MDPGLLEFFQNFWYKSEAIKKYIYAMRTLYDVLGVSSSASNEQIEAAYHFALNSLGRNGASKSPEEEAIRAKAIKEAYAVLSTPMRRDAYDAKLRARQAPAVSSPVETDGLPWGKIAIALFVLLIGVVYAYKSQVDEAKAETERLAIEAAKAKADAEQAALQAKEEEARLIEQRLREQNRVAEANRREMERARLEGQRVHENLQRFEARAEYEKQREQQNRERAERQAAYEKERQERMARARAREQDAAMERALARPIPRY